MARLNVSSARLKGEPLSSLLTHVMSLKKLTHLNLSGITLTDQHVATVTRAVKTLPLQELYETVF